MTPDWNAPLSESEREELLEKIANGIVKRGMSVPAVLFLEMHKPLSFLAGQGLIVASPFVAPLVGYENLRAGTRLLADRENIERLIRRIEDKDQDRRQAPSGEAPGA